MKKSMFTEEQPLVVATYGNLMALIVNGLV